MVDGTGGNNNNSHSCLWLFLWFAFLPTGDDAVTPTIAVKVAVAPVHGVQVLSWESHWRPGCLALAGLSHIVVK